MAYLFGGLLAYAVKLAPRRSAEWTYGGWAPCNSVATIWAYIIFYRFLTLLQVVQGRRVETGMYLLNRIGIHKRAQRNSLLFFLCNGDHRGIHLFKFVCRIFPTVFYVCRK